MLEKLIRTYRELGLTKTETLFLLEVLVHEGRYLESEATFKYNPSTIKKIRQALYDKALLTWTIQGLFGDSVYIYDTSALEKKLKWITESKPDKSALLMSYVRALEL